MKNVDLPNRLLAGVILILFACVPGQGLYANQVTIAVTSDFDFTLDELKQAFEEVSEHTVRVVPGSSRQHYGEIIDGAPYDLFLADDSERPRALEDAGKTVPGTRFTYARGKLVLWSVNNRPLGPQVLQNGEFRTLAITNPRLSRYGKAEQQALEALAAWDGAQDKLVLGDNIGQTYQLAISGDVEMAIILYAQIIFGRYFQAGSYWLVPENLYAPLEFQAVQLTQNPGASEFLAFMQSEDGQAIILSNGYDVP